MTDHKANFFLSNLICRNNEVAFVFSIFIIENNDKLTFSYCFQSFFNCIFHVLRTSL